MKLLSIPVYLTLALAFGCATEADGGDAAPDGESGTADEGGDGATDDDGSGADDGGSGSPETGDDSSGSDGDEDDDTLARGIQITEVIANQGVAVPIAKDGEWVDGAARNAELIAEREILIQALWELEDGWEPREIEGRMILGLPDGSEEVGTRTLEITGPSSQGSLDHSMWWVLPKELAQPGATFRVELHETDDAYLDAPPPATPPVAPVDGPAVIGFESDDMEIRVLVVLVDHDLGDHCPSPPNITQDDLDLLAEAMYLYNPVQRVEVTKREEVFTWTGGLFSPLLNALSQLREQDGADPNVYYYGFVRPCDGAASNIAGQAYTIPDAPLKEYAWGRVAAGQWNSSAYYSAATFVHEIGHLQGRKHVHCAGSEDNTDSAYPYDGGKTGVWGFLLPVPDPHIPQLSYDMVDPGVTADYMSYCPETFASDYGWRKIAPFVRELTSWGNGAPEPDPGQLLIGALMPDGTEDWITVSGSLGTRGHTPNEHIELHVAGTILSIPALVERRPCSNTQNVIAELPRPLEEINTIVRVSNHLRTPIAIEAVRTSLNR